MNGARLPVCPIQSVPRQGQCKGMSKSTFNNFLPRWKEEQGLKMHYFQAEKALVLQKLIQKSSSFKKFTGPKDSPGDKRHCSFIAARTQIYWVSYRHSIWLSFILTSEKPHQSSLTGCANTQIQLPSGGNRGLKSAPPTKALLLFVPLCNIWDLFPGLQLHSVLSCSRKRKKQSESLFKLPLLTWSAAETNNFQIIFSNVEEGPHIFILRLNIYN